MLTKKTLRRYPSSLADLSSDDDDEARRSTSSTRAVLDPEKQWERDFHKYIDLNEDVSEGMPMVQWWGVSYFSTILELSHIITHVMF